MGVSAPLVTAGFSVRGVLTDDTTQGLHYTYLRCTSGLTLLRVRLKFNPAVSEDWLADLSTEFKLLASHPTTLTCLGPSKFRDRIRTLSFDASTTLRRCARMTYYTPTSKRCYSER